MMAKLLTEAQLHALEPHCGHKHVTRIFVAGDADERLARWQAEGRPAVWEIVEECGGFAAATDSSYGLLALFRGDKCLGVGKSSVIAEAAVLLDREYYGTAKFIWV